MIKSRKAISVTLILVAYLVISFGFIRKSEEKLNCRDIQIVIKDSTEHRFLHVDELREAMLKQEIKPLGTLFAGINTKEMEQFFKNNPYVKTSEVYKQSDGLLTIELTQRTPMLRVINFDGDSYYIDTEGNILPTRDSYSAHILVATGLIPDHFNLSQRNNIYQTKTSETLQEVFQLAKFITSDEFWNAQVVQLYADKNREYELIPRIGPHVIQLGTVDNFKTKLKKLRLLYAKGFNNIGWNQYLYINLKYDNQIICTKN
jgi:cell division protein FtsQ